MGFFFKFLLGFVFFYLLLKALVTFLTGRRTKESSNFRREQGRQTHRAKQPDNQQNRIIEYQKKKFESSEIEDADYVEIKDKV